MKIRSSVKKLCKFCKVFYRFKRLNVQCRYEKHKQRQR